MTLEADTGGGDPMSHSSVETITIRNIHYLIDVRNLRA
jgi:hypothetical protein